MYITFYLLHAYCIKGFKYHSVSLAWPFLQNESLFRGDHHTAQEAVKAVSWPPWTAAPGFPIDCSLLCSTWPPPPALATRLTPSQHWPISRSREMLRKIVFGAAQSHESENMIRFLCLPNTILHVVHQANHWALLISHFRWSSGGPGQWQPSTKGA